MKLAWLVKALVEDTKWHVEFTEPISWQWEVIIPIAYAELQDGPPK